MHLFKKNELLKIGHRGAPTLCHENTINSFLKAIEAGLKGIELDVQLTLDKKLIVYHDWYIKINPNKKIKIENILYSEINNDRNENCKIPLLIDVLNILPNDCIKIIEIKSKYISNTKIEYQILKIINEYNIEDSTIISSFNPFILYRIKSLKSNIQTAFLWTKKQSQLIFNTPLWIWFCRPDGFHVDIKFLDIYLVNWARNNNLSVMAYTIINQLQLDKAKKLKIDGIFVDDPYLN